MIRLALVAVVLLVAINGLHHGDLLDGLWIAHIAHWGY